MRTLQIVGPREPSGITWLVNCLIELGIETTIYENLFLSENEYKIINPAYWHYSRLLPSLSDLERKFRFRNDIKINFSHKWISEELAENQTIIFTRNPQTSMYSSYKRIGKKDETFYNFITKPDKKWILNRLQVWNLWHLFWMTHPSVKVLSFEDYKSDSLSTLKKSLTWFNLENFSNQELIKSIELSDWSAARASEERYIAKTTKTETNFRWAGSGNTDPIEPDKEKESYDLISEICSPVYNAITSGGNLHEYFDLDYLKIINKRYGSYSFEASHLRKFYKITNKKLILLNTLEISNSSLSQNNKELAAKTSTYLRLIITNSYLDWSKIRGLKKAKYYSFGKDLIKAYLYTILRKNKDKQK